MVPAVMLGCSSVIGSKILHITHLHLKIQYKLSTEKQNKQRKPQNKVRHGCKVSQCPHSSATLFSQSDCIFIHA